jgi:hypothetical protein
MTARRAAEVPADRDDRQNIATGPPDDAGPLGPYWDVRVGRGGMLTATLAGTQPPIVLTADDEESLRKQIKTLIMRAML